MELVQQLAEHIILHLQKTKYKFMSITDIQELLKEKLGDEYNIELGMSVRYDLMEHPHLDFFLEGSYVDDSRFHYCTGSWLAPKGLYGNPVEAKRKMGWYSWQASEDDEGLHLD